MKNAFTNYNL